MKHCMTFSMDNKNIVDVTNSPKDWEDFWNSFNDYYNEDDRANLSGSDVRPVHDDAGNEDNAHNTEDIEGH